ncbi:MAG: trimethylamine methyltransferase family protein [Deltaproteobacteria bacterium]|nr:MAG: trimethylamine methyltransferase family protein [Deltaproteobacteria bacterium]
MIANQLSQRPALRFLSQADKARIQHAVMEILEDIGMQILHDEAVALLKKGGCKVEKDDVIKIPGSLLDKALQSAPRNIPIYDREGNHVMDLGGRRSYFGTGSDLLFSLDGQTMARRDSVLDDVRRAARLCDALPNIDFIMSCAHPTDVIPQRAYLESFQAMVENSTKPIVTTAESRDDLREMWEIAVSLRGGEEELRSKPYMIQYVEPISPLKHPFFSLDKLLFCAEKSFPVVYSPAPLAGATAPITIAGHVAQGLAECFCGLVLHQLKAEGAPFLMGMGPAVMDMASSQSSYNAPEYYLGYVAAIEMSHYYNLPSWGYAGTSDSQIPDGQAALEAALITFLSTMAGANLNHDVGYLDFGRTGSLEMIVIMDEIIDQMRRLQKGISVNDEMLGLDVIREVGPGGHFLTHDHTYKHFRSTQWRPKLISRTGYEQWQESGSLSLLGRARQRLLEILETHQPTPIPEDQWLAIQSRVNKFKNKN